MRIDRADYDKPMDKHTERQRLHQRTQETIASTNVDSDQTVPESDADVKQHAFLKPGYVVAGRYKIVSQIGRGGMGVVYKVEQASLKAVHALKILDSGKASQTAFARFQKEAQASFHLNHRNLIRVYDLGVLEDDYPYLVMDYAEGITLSELIKSRGKLPVNEALEIFLQVCDGIGYAHEHGVIHRDLKPGNIMLTETSGSVIVKIVDFGIAKFVEADEQQSLTRTGEVFGSPLYMSPEQCMGLQIDLRSDIYACGCALFETLTGDPPFLSGTALATMLKHQTETPSTLQQATLGEKFPDSLEYVVAKLLAKLPADRYQSMMALKHDLLAVKEGRPLASAAYPKVTSKSSRSKVFAIVAIASTVIAGAAIALFVGVHSNEPQTPVATVAPTTAAPATIATTTVPQAVPSDLSTQNTSTPKSHAKASEGFDVETDNYAAVPLKKAAGGRWELNFPEKSLGNIWVTQKDGSKKGADAKGHVVFEHAAPLEFKPNLDAFQNGLAFRRFRPDELSKVMFLPDPLVTDDLLLSLNHLTGLHELSLQNCSITDEGMAHLESLPGLTELQLGITEVTAKELVRMKSLKKWERFQAVDMKDVSVLIHALRNSTALTSLILTRDRVSDDDVEVLSHIKSLRSLKLPHNDHVTDQSVAYLTKLPNLSALDLSWCNVTVKSIPYFKQMHALKGLKITTNKWSDADRRELQRAVPFFSAK
jgi:serine/threonine protein kinase